MVNKLSLKRVDTKNKKMLISISLVIALATCLMIYITNKTHSTSDEKVLENQVIDTLSFENAKLEYDGNISTLTVEIYNDTENDYSLKNVDIVITLDNDKKEMLNGYIGNNIKTHEAKVLSASIDKDITKIKNIEYVINK